MLNSAADPITESMELPLGAPRPPSAPRTATRGVKERLATLPRAR